MASLDRDSSRLQVEMQNASSQVDAFGGQRGQLALEFETVSQRLTILTTEIGETRSLLESKRREESSAKNQLDSLRAEFATALGKRGSLEAVIAEHGYSTESVRRLFQSGVMNGGLAPVGVLADFLEVDTRYEGVVEDFLRDELNYVVVKSWDAADEGLRLLRTDVDGRATFLVHPEDSQAKFSFHVDEAARSATPSQSVVPLKHTIRVLNGFGKSLEVILPKLRDGYIVPDATVGRELALGNPDAFFLSESGECFHNVTVTGGRQRAEGPLSMKRELRDVLRLLSDLEQTLRHEEIKVVTLGREIAEYSSLLERLESEKREAEKQSMTSGHRLSQLDSEMSRISERLQMSRSELSRLASDRAEQEAAIESLQSEIDRLRQRQDELESAASGATEQLSSLRHRRELAAQNRSEQMARLATLEERHRSANAVLERIESLVAEMTQRVGTLQAQIDSSLEEKLQREEESEQLSVHLGEMDALRNATETRDALLQFESEQVRARLSELDETLREMRQSLEQAHERRAVLSAAAAKSQSDAQHLDEVCLNELNIQRQELITDSSIQTVSGDELVSEDAVYRDMRTRLEAMGPVNMMALEEYKERGRTTWVSGCPKKRLTGFNREHPGHHQGNRCLLAPEVRRGIRQD